MRNLLKWLYQVCHAASCSYLNPLRCPRRFALLGAARLSLTKFVLTLDLRTLGLLFLEKKLLV